MKIVNRKKRRVILLVFAMKKEFDAFFDDKDIFYTKIDLVDGFSFYKTKINPLHSAPSKSERSKQFPNHLILLYF